jgi:hypothetical protein
MAGTPDVIHDLVAALFLKRFPDPSSDVVENLIPTGTLPLSFSPLARPLERIPDPFGVRHLI